MDQIDGKFKYISVDKYGVWALDLDDQIYYREGLSDFESLGIGWAKIEGLLKQISVGYFGLYGINNENQAFTKDLKLMI